jgi:hypothetical protein
VRIRPLAFGACLRALLGPAGAALGAPAAPDLNAAPLDGAGQQDLDGDWTKARFGGSAARAAPR